jgi:hypothetical protein
MGYSRKYTIVHLAVVTGRLDVVQLCERLLGVEWNSLLEKPNGDQQTPLQLARYMGFVNIYDYLLGEDQIAKESKRLPKVVESARAAMPIEQELQEQRLDGFGAKCRAKLASNANGKRHWLK